MPGIFYSNDSITAMLFSPYIIGLAGLALAWPWRTGAGQLILGSCSCWRQLAAAMAGMRSVCDQYSCTAVRAVRGLDPLAPLAHRPRVKIQKVVPSAVRCAAAARGAAGQLARE